MGKDKVKRIAEKYAEKLVAENFPFAAIFLFGSQAKGRARRWSDIDIAVISDKFKRKWNENEELLWRYTIEVDSRIEPVGFTVKDFKEGLDPLIKEIKKNGIRIA
jgi:predicted nucleotidyltransferase